MFADETAEPAPDDALGYVPALIQKRNGWTADRQRTFLTVLAETGSISQACGSAGVSSRSAYRLRQRPDAAAFARAWDDALKLASLRLMTLAFERATRGSVSETWKDGDCVRQTRTPSDRMLIYLLDRLLPAGEARARWSGFETMVDGARGSFPETLGGLADHSVELVPITSRDFYPVAPGDDDEDT